jgi:hypothetical protein
MRRYIGDSQGIKQRCKEYFQELLNGSAGMDDDIINRVSDLINNDDNEDTASSEVQVFANILHNRLEPVTERIIEEYQTGFRPGRSTIDQLFTVKQTLEKCWEYNMSVYQIYVDFKQAYIQLCMNLVCHLS